MDVLEMFTNQMGYEDATEGSTYIESINGLPSVRWRIYVRMDVLRPSRGLVKKLQYSDGRRC